MGVNKRLLKEYGGREYEKGIWQVHYRLPDILYAERGQQLAVTVCVESEELEEEEFEILSGKAREKIAVKVFESSISTESYEDYKKGALKFAKPITGDLSGDYKDFMITVAITTNDREFPWNLKTLGEFAEFHRERENSILLLGQIIDKYRLGKEK
ncbi:MAG: hypothetical protein U9R01_00595 [candidate division WOR-3 bacterium]|nr:hypothetical protein [candidate division WOR-3 bacterium]